MPKNQKKLKESIKNHQKKSKEIVNSYKKLRSNQLILFQKLIIKNQNKNFLAQFPEQLSEYTIQLQSIGRYILKRTNTKKYYPVTTPKLPLNYP